MIDRANALKDLDRASLGELTTTNLEAKYRMPLNDLIELTGWKPGAKQIEIPTATVVVNNSTTAPATAPSVDEVVIDLSTKEGQETLATQSMTAIIEMLSPLTPDKQRRVVESVATYFGVPFGSQ